MPEPNSPPPLADATHTPARPTVSPSELLTSGETDEASSGSFAVVKVGDTLAGYKLIQLLGEGGMGLVFAAEDIRLKRKVALKMMKPEIAAKASHRERFLREAQAAVVVEHDHIVAIHQIGEEKGIPFIVMPFLQGEPLDVRLKRGRLSAPEFMSIGRQVAEGLAAAHAKGLIHRDIKPANIWLEAGSSPRAKILDFGLARLTNDEVHLTQSGAIMGTPAYMSPEQARGIKVDHRADLFSLGVMLYEMSTGQRPFTGHDTMSVLFSLASDTPVPPIELNPDLPPIFSRLVERLLAKDVEKRIQTGRDVADVLQRLQPEKTVVVIATSQPIVEENPFADLDSSSATNVGVTYSLDEESSERSATRTSNSVRGAQPRSKKTMYFAFAGIALLALSIGAFFAFRGKNEPKPDAVVKSNDPPKKAKIDPPRTNPLPIVAPNDLPAYVPVTLEEKEAKKLQADCAAKLKTDVETKSPTGIAMVLIPPGGEALPKAYLLGKYEVTQGEWETVMGYNPSAFKKGSQAVEGLDTSRFPVEGVSWFESVEYCNKLSAQEGMKPYYDLTVTKRSGPAIDEAEVNILGGNGYHIPTDAEWEHGCRAGTKSKYHFGDKDDDLGDYGWYNKNSEGRTHGVGEKKPNAFGLYDMHGNVWEWNEAILTNAKGAPERVYRGGSFYSPAGNCAVSSRSRYGPASRTSSYGLRLARVPSGEAQASK